MSTRDDTCSVVLGPRTTVHAVVTAWPDLAGDFGVGVAAASLVYFDKSVNELTVAEAAYLAALPKAPTPGKTSFSAVRRGSLICALPPAAGT